MEEAVKQVLNPGVQPNTSQSQQPRAEVREVPHAKTSAGPSRLAEAIQAKEQFKFDSRKGIVLSEISEKAEELGMDLEARLVEFAEEEQVLARIQKILGAPAKSGIRGEIVLDYRSIEHPDDFMTRLIEKMKTQPEGIRLAIFKDPETSPADWVRMVARFSKEFAELAAQGRMVRPTVDQKFGTLERFIRSRKVEWDQVVQILTQVRDPKLAEATMLGGVSLAQQYELVVIGAERPMANVKTLTFAQILEAIFEGAEAIEVSA